MQENPSGVAQPTYDSAGNMTGVPAPADWTKNYTCKWDAWDRLAEVKDGATVVAAYAYDGLTRRTQKTIPSETRHYYYNDSWRALEERVDGASVTVDRQDTWNLTDRWDFARRKRSTGGSSLNETHYVGRVLIPALNLERWQERLKKTRIFL